MELAYDEGHKKYYMFHRYSLWDRIGGKLLIAMQNM